MFTFNLSLALERLIADIVVRHGAFSHIDPSRLLICLNSARGGVSSGIYAKIHPLRFEGGEMEQTIQRGRSNYRCIMPKLTSKGTDLLYVIYFTIPRFMDRGARDKLVTVFHELYHISPQFDGDLRRFPGKNFAHGSSTKKYNALMGKFVDEYLAGPEATAAAAFLDHDMKGLKESYRVIVGRRMKMPKIQVERV